MNITMCHIIGLVAIYVGISAIRKKETFLSPIEEEATEENKTYIRGVWAILVGLLITGLGVKIIFFESNCFPISDFFK